jgi:hypothetical protein
VEHELAEPASGAAHAAPGSVGWSLGWT